MRTKMINRFASLARLLARSLRFARRFAFRRTRRAAAVEPLLFCPPPTTEATRVTRISLCVSARAISVRRERRLSDLIGRRPEVGRTSAAGSLLADDEVRETCSVLLRSRWARTALKV